MKYYFLKCINSLFEKPKTKKIYVHMFLPFLRKGKVSLANAEFDNRTELLSGSLSID